MRRFLRYGGILPEERKELNSDSFDFPTPALPGSGSRGRGAQPPLSYVAPPAVFLLLLTLYLIIVNGDEFVKSRIHVFGVRNLKHIAAFSSIHEPPALTRFGPVKHVPAVTEH